MYLNRRIIQSYIFSLNRIHCFILVFYVVTVHCSLNSDSFCSSVLIQGSMSLTLMEIKCRYVFVLFVRE